MKGKTKEHDEVGEDGQEEEEGDDNED